MKQGLLDRAAALCLAAAVTLSLLGGVNGIAQYEAADSLYALQHADHRDAQG